MEIVLTALHVTVCLFLIFVVLLQSGQAADLAGAFGGGGSQTALGMRGAATLLTKLTTAAAIIFMLTSLSLGISGRQESTVLDDFEPAPVTAPAQDAADAPAPASSDPSGQAQDETGRGPGR